MFPKPTTIAALLLGSTYAQPVTRQTSTGSVNVVNNTPDGIPYALMAQNDASPVSSGTINPGQTINLPMSPDSAGYVAKLAGPSGNPQADNNILQFEYTYSSANQNSVSFDWSIVNGPNPFSQYQRTIAPSQPSGTCVSITCNAGQDDDSCEFVSPSDGIVQQCPDFDGVVLTATIG